MMDKIQRKLKFLILRDRNRMVRSTYAFFESHISECFTIDPKHNRVPSRDFRNFSSISERHEIKLIFLLICYFRPYFSDAPADFRWKMKITKSGHIYTYNIIPILHHLHLEQIIFILHSVPIIAFEYEITQIFAFWRVSVNYKIVYSISIYTPIF